MAEAQGCFIVVVGTIAEKNSKAGFGGGTATHKLVIKFNNDETGQAGLVNVKYASAADLEKTPPKGALVKAVFKTKPSGQYDTDFPKGDLVSLEQVDGARHPSPLGTR